MALRALRAIAAVLGLTLSTACDVPQDPQPSLEIGVTVPTTHLDPARGEEPGTMLVARFAFRTLPQIARITPGPSPRIWFVTIEPGQRFSDGTKIDADAVRANFSRWSAGLTSFVKYAREFGPRSPHTITSIGRFDGSQSMSIATRSAFPQFVKTLDDPHFSLLSPASFAHGLASAAIPVGNGAYTIAAFVPGGFTLLVPAPGSSSPKYASIRIDEIPDPHTAVLALDKNDVSVVYGFPEHDLDEARAGEMNPTRDPQTGLWCAFAAGLTKRDRECPPGASLPIPNAESGKP